MADKIEDGGPAFPVREYSDRNPGMTMRDYFAGQALIGLKALVRDDCGWNPEDYAKDAFDLADSMLKARKGEL